MTRHHKISLLTLGLLSGSFEAIESVASPSPPLKRKTVSKKTPKGCFGPFSQYFDDYYYTDDWYDRCRDYWLDVGPSVSPSMSSQPSSFPSFKPSSEPSQSPSFIPTDLTTMIPSQEPSINPVAEPSFVPTRIPSSTPTKLHSIIPSQEPSTTPIAEPSIEPTKSPSIAPSNQPSTKHSYLPSAIPSLRHSAVPTDLPSVAPITPTATPSEMLSEKPSSSPSIFTSKEPSTQPSQSPSEGPSISQKPSSIIKFTIPLSQFNIALTFESNNNNRRLSSQNGEEQRKLTLVREDLLFDTVFILLSDSFTRNLKDFYALDLKLVHLNTKTNYGTRTTQTTATYRFSGSVVLKTNGLLDVASIPSESELELKTLQAFSSYNGDITDGINDATHDSFRSWVISKVGSNSFDQGNGSDEVETVVEVSTGNGAMTITVAASIVAILSTLTAFGLIYNQTRARKSEITMPTPRNKLQQEEHISKNRKFRSPFLNVTPPDGRRKYFSKLDDESVNSKNYGQPLNPEQSMVDSSFDESYAESLQAPSMSASKLGGQSMDLESLAGMSALDNVRLNSVLQIDEDGQDAKSIASNDTGSFRKIWYGRKHKITKERSIKKLSPPSKDSPAKFSPLITSELKGTPDSKESKDHTNLLDDQSNKGEYYGESEDSVLFYNILSRRSTVSDSSEDINFNELYNGDGVASSSGTSSVQLSEYDVVSR